MDYIHTSAAEIQDLLEEAAADTEVEFAEAGQPVLVLALLSFLLPFQILHLLQNQSPLQEL